MELQQRRKEFSFNFDVIIVGGGLTGVCAAIASARNGAKTALVHDRHVLGGNASSEIRMHICGASANRTKANAEETGIINEILLDNKANNNYYNFSIWDNILFQKVNRQENLNLYLNTSMIDVESSDDKITAIHCYQLTTEKHFILHSKIFVDCTGNGTLAYTAGGSFREGCEGKEEFSEPDAPDYPNKNRMGNTLLFKSIDRGEPVKFRSPEWARHFTEDDLKYRRHGEINQKLTVDGKPVNNNSAEQPTFWVSGLDYGYWWIELPGESDDYVSEYESIRDELVSCVYGVWDHMKNHGEHGAENYDLQWVGMLPGVREGRRLAGHYILTENDILENRIFKDAVAYGGWPIDNHTPGGLDDKDKAPSFVRDFPGFYTIPYRCYCNLDFSNLMQGGRIISASKLAMASTRVMGTCSVGGQAIGTAAAMCVQKQCLPMELENSISELQQQLLRDDCFIPGFKNEDEGDLAKTGRISATSSKLDMPPEAVINGYSRQIGDDPNCWESDGISDEGEALTLQFPKEVNISQVRITYDSNLNLPKKITLSAKRIAEQQVGVPVELVKDYDVIFLHNGSEVYRHCVNDNYQRLNVIDLPQPIACDSIVLLVKATNGYPNARVYEVRAYEQKCSK